MSLNRNDTLRKIRKVATDFIAVCFLVLVPVVYVFHIILSRLGRNGFFDRDPIYGNISFVLSRWSLERKEQ